MQALAVLAAAAFVAGGAHPIKHAYGAPAFGDHGAWLNSDAGYLDLSGRILTEPVYTSPSGRYTIHYQHEAPYTVTVGQNVLADAFSAPSWNADESELVFAQGDGLALADGDGSNVRTIPIVTGCEDGSCYANFGAPVLSPDGRSIAVVVTTVPSRGGPYKNVPGGVAIVPVTGGELRGAGDEETCEPDADVQWSSDSQFVSYLAGDCDAYGNELRIARASDGRATHFRASTVSYAWAPTGDLFAYETKHAVGLATPAGQVRALHGATSPTWSGQRLAVARAGRIEVLNAPDGTPHTLAHGSSPSWSPTGEWIAYAVTQCGARQGIHLIHPDGSGDHRLAKVCIVEPNGARVVGGTPYDDEIAGHDERAERISCGAGADTVYADRSDRISRDCERVVRGH